MAAIRNYNAQNEARGDGHGRFVFGYLKPPHPTGYSSLEFRNTYKWCAPGSTACSQKGKTWHGHWHDNTNEYPEFSAQVCFQIWQETSSIINFDLPGFRFEWLINIFSLIFFKTGRHTTQGDHEVPSTMALPHWICSEENQSFPRKMANVQKMFAGDLIR